MVNRQFDAVAELQSAFTVLTKNLVLAVPTALVSLAGGLFAVFVAATIAASILGAGALSGMGGTGEARPGIWAALAGGTGLLLIVFFVAIVLLGILAQAVVMGGAERVWHGQPADLMAGVSKAMGKIGPLFLLFLIGLIVGVICFVIIIIGWIAGIVLAFFFMYTIPAIVVGNQGVMDALRTSWRLVRENIGPSLTAFLGIIVVSAIGAVINRVFLHIPIIGLIVSFVVGGLTAAYSALVLVRFYDLLRGQAPAISTTTAGPTT